MTANKIDILIVEDNQEFAGILKDFLESKSEFKVIGIANDGIEALSYIKRIDIDLIILDLIMPRLDGIGVLEELSSMNLSKKSKVIVLSAVGNDNLIQKALSLGANYFIVKPFDMNVFCNRVIDLFREGKINHITNT